MFRDNCPLHVFSKTKDGYITFYSARDCLFYLTLYSVLSVKYKIKVSSFCIMPNHIHSQEMSDSEKLFIKFHGELNSTFAREYNKRHRRGGPLFLKPFGYAAKPVGKKIRENISYIANNPVVGGLCPDPLAYRWSLLSYYDNPSPFSSKIHIDKASAGMRKALKMCDYYIERKLPLDYTRQELLFSALCKSERNQLIDYIISKYNCIDYQIISSYFGGGFENALLAIRANSGSEYDIPEDYDDYSIYSKMVGIVHGLGYDMSTFCPETLTENERVKLISYLSATGGKQRQIMKFLHFPPGA